MAGNADEIDAALKQGDALAHQGAIAEALDLYRDTLASARSLYAAADDLGKPEKLRLVRCLIRVGEWTGEAGAPFWQEAHDILSALNDAGKLDPGETWMLADTKGRAEYYGRR